MSNLVVTQSLGVANTRLLVFGLAWFCPLGANSLAWDRDLRLAALVLNFTTMAIEYIYMGLAPNLVIINMGYQLLAYLVAGAVLGLTPRTAPATA